MAVSTGSDGAPRVVITARAFGLGRTGAARRLTEAGFDVVLKPSPADSLGPDVLVQLLGGARAVIAGVERYTEEVLAQLQTLQIICRFGVGLDSVDVAAATRHGIWVAALPAANHVAVAEHTIGLMIAVMRRIAALDRAVKRGEWVLEPGPELRGKTLGIVGLGRIGREVARLALAFGMRVVATDVAPDEAFAQRHGVQLTSLDELLRCSDVVSLHVPATPRTRHLINDRALALMKPGSYLINTSRGALVDEAAVYRALESGHLAGVGLDVTDPEPPAERRLVGHPGAVVTCHVAGLSTEAIARMESAAVETVLQALSGKLPDNVVNAGKQDGEALP